MTLADVVAWGRVGVPRDGYSKEIQHVPSPETPARLAKQFVLLAKALALVKGRAEIGDAELVVLRKVAVDTMIDLRVLILRHLYTSPEWVDTTSIARAINSPPTTALRLLEDCWVLKIIHRNLDAGDDDTDRGRKPFRWQMSESFRAILYQSGIFDLGSSDDVPF